MEVIFPSEQYVLVKRFLDQFHKAYYNLLLLTRILLNIESYISVGEVYRDIVVINRMQFLLEVLLNLL